MRKVLLFVVLPAMIVIFGACQEGDRGPTGPKGESGGSPVAIVLELVNANFTQWSTNVWICDTAVSAIDAGVIDSGAVLGYYQSAFGMVLELPWMSDNQQSRKYFHHVAGMVRFVCAEYGSSPVLSAAGTWKLVIITGSLGKRQLEGVDTRDYNAVRAALRLEE
jgi:hypothetical protein